MSRRLGGRIRDGPLVPGSEGGRWVRDGPAEGSQHGQRVRDGPAEGSKHGRLEEISESDGLR